jgi:hypothetical protein
VSRPDLNPWHDAVLQAGDLIDSARRVITDQPQLDAALRILDALIGGVPPDPADMAPVPFRCPPGAIREDGS